MLSNINSANVESFKVAMVILRFICLQMMLNYLDILKMLAIILLYRKQSTACKIGANSGY